LCRCPGGRVNIIGKSDLVKETGSPVQRIIPALHSLPVHLNLTRQAGSYTTIKP
jgi:hypothetical protein